MSRIVLIKTPETFSDFNGSKTTCGEKVVGIYQLGSKTVTEHGYRPTGREDEEEFNLDDFTSNRLLEFYNRCYAAKPQDRPYYNCHLLAWFITGSITCLKKYDDYYSDQNKLVDDAAFLPGKTYAVV